MNVRKLLLAILALAFFGWYFGSPWLTLREMQQAAADHDAAALASHVDFPALRASAKQAVSMRLARKLAGKQQLHQRDVLVSALVSTVAREAIDRMLTPEGIARLLAASSEDAATPAGEARKKKPATAFSFTYEDFDTFLVQVRPAGQKRDAMTLVMRRQGLADWKVVGVRL